MDPITAALIAGATAAASGVASKAVTDAYEGLKRVLADGYAFTSAKFLEKKPASPDYQQAVADEVKETPALSEDKAVGEKVAALGDALKAEPPAQLAAWGVDLRKLTVAGNLKVENVENGVHGDEWSAGGDATFFGIGKSPGNR